MVGDRYSLLIVREIGYGYRRFQQLAGFTGAPATSSPLACADSRRSECIERRQYSEHPERYEYHLTEAGEQLRPIVLALKEWGDQQCAPGTEPVVFRHSCGAEFHPLTVCAACGQPVGSGELTVAGGTHPVRGGPW